MSLDEIRIGLVGCQRGSFVTRVSRFLERTHLRATYDVDAGRAQAVASEVPDCRAFGPGDWVAFLESGIRLTTRGSACWWPQTAGSG